MMSPLQIDNDPIAFVSGEIDRRLPYRPGIGIRLVYSIRFVCRIHPFIFVKKRERITTAFICVAVEIIGMLLIDNDLLRGATGRVRLDDRRLASAAGTTRGCKKKKGEVLHYNSFAGSQNKVLKSTILSPFTFTPSFSSNFFLHSR